MDFKTGGRDFLCLEITTSVDSITAHIDFEVFLNLKSRTGAENIKVTWPELKNFLRTHEVGKELAELTLKSPVRIGSVQLLSAGRPGNERFIINDFHPIGTRISTNKWRLFEYLRHKRLGSLIELQIARRIMQEYPNSRVRNVCVLTKDRWDLLENQLKYAEVTEYVPIREYYSKLKAFIAKHAVGRNFHAQKIKLASRRNRKLRLKGSRTARKVR